MPKEYKFFLKQHIGASSKAVVKVGEIVKKGTILGEIPSGQLGAVIHSSISGKVTAVDDEKILIMADESQDNKYIPIKGNTILELIQNAGIVGMGGAGFPTHIKLGTPFKEKGVVIVNAAECEPILTHNIVRIEKNSAQIYQGLLYAMKAVNAKKGIIAIKEKHQSAIKKLQMLIENNSSIKIKILPDLYPMGEERAIIREVLGILLKPDQLPLTANAVICNAETIYRIAEAVDLRKPLISKDLTVAGQLQAENTKVMLDVPVGMMSADVLAKDGNILEPYGEIIMGGPFTGKPASLNTPISKTTGGLIVTMPFFREKKPLGLLVCACGGNEERLKDIANNMGADVADVQFCKQAKRQANNTLKCENPGCCPGQAERILRLKKAGAKALLISNCTDCTNTVMALAPKLKMPVYHETDHALRAVHLPLIRKMKLN